MQRFKYGKASDLEMPYLFFKIISKKAVKDCVAQGYGRHSKEEGKNDAFNSAKIIFLYYFKFMESEKRI